MGNLDRTPPARVIDVMTRGLWTAAPDTTVRQALALMTAEHLSALPVESEEGGILGHVTHNAVLDASARGMDGTPLAFIMEPVWQYCLPGESLEYAKTMMKALGTEHLAVCNRDGRPVGMISRERIARHLMHEQLAAAPARPWALPGAAGKDEMAVLG